MSGLSMRTRITTVAVSAAIVAPFALMGGSANAVEAPVVGNVGTPVDGILNGVLGTATGQAGGLLGSTGLPLGTVTSAASDPTSIVDSTLGSVLGTDVLSGVTNVADLESVLGTVTNLVDVGKIIKTVTDLVGSVTDALNLDDLLQLPVKVLTGSKGEVAGASKTTTKAAKPAATTVEAGALPHTGGNADLTAMLLCAGLAVAGTGVTLVTRRRNALLGV
jgi:hypothetical protein